MNVGRRGTRSSDGRRLSSFALAVVEEDVVAVAVDALVLGRVVMGERSSKEPSDFLTREDFLPFRAERSSSESLRVRSSPRDEGNSIRLKKKKKS